MKKRIIITDSASDISEELEKKLNIKILPFKLSVDGTSYTSRTDFNNEEFYTILENAKSLPTTSQITPFEFVELYTELYKEGYEDVILVLINSKGSATYSNSQNAINAFFEDTPDAKGKINIYTVDGRSYSGAYGLPVIHAAEKLQSGEDTKKIISYLEDYTSRSIIYAGLYTLKYAGKSGRISGAAAFVGDVLGLKPLMRIADNEITTKDKVRGEKKIIPTTIDKVAEVMEDGAEYFVVYGNDETIKDQIVEEATQKFGYPPVECFRIGAAIAINAGPKIVGIGTLRKK